jgi:hypothetical protein
MPPKAKSSSSTAKDKSSPRITTNTARAPKKEPDIGDISHTADADTGSHRDERDHNVEDEPVPDKLRTGSRKVTLFGKTYAVPDYKSYSSSKTDLEQPYY